MADINDPGLLTPAETSLLIDRYEITMAASYHRLGRNDRAVFELFVRKLPPHRDWLVVCGLGPTLRLITEMRFGPAELEYLGTLGCNDDFLRYLVAHTGKGSDGLAERFNSAGEMLGYDMIKEFLLEHAGSSPQAILDDLVRASDVWADGKLADDDMTFVALRRKAQ